ncbi:MULTISPECIES: long-chain-fatty-acid--CoA ligase [Bacillaceae]|uniref:Long-chain fatty acid--CoA ligase n=1 Tax=Gottfriedia luciferensis TaxID=178774 RepID=A0ABX2ZQZ3_9BACI|nr:MULTISPECIES: long-chain-fatty-acid--CoA ligase [Bacillaceae]ODG92166.1 long-chain fatty acid--CoA ligase [Gottfriedia luciferensis]PGZ88575.1 long-chain fatty acid--CoA ligase [Bacillus sp. AFS029533]SFC67294.1 long-chain acyl-CoA synthetase [Bacillus sp. UNCCL81]
MSLNLYESLKKSAEKFPNHNAITFKNKNIKYSVLLSQVECVASKLIHDGVKKGDRVALILGNCPEFVTAYYGILRAGGVVIPINPIFTKDEILFILSNSEAKAVIADSTMDSIIDTLKVEIKQIEIMYYVESNKAELSWWKLLDTKSNGNEYPLITEDDLAVILYTSGTTGKPKGAMLSHRNLVSNARSIVELVEFNKNDRILAVLPMFHVFCLSICINAPIICGANIVIVPRFSPSEVMNTIFNEQVTLFAGVPTMYNFLLQLKEYSAEYFTSIRACFSGGASLPIELLQRFEEKYKTIVIEGFGLSETAPVTAFNPLKGERKFGSVGVNIPGVLNKVVDKNGFEVPRGEIGELIVKGPNVMIGYLGMPEETAKVIKNDWFYTGDLAKMDNDGYIYIVDRIKDMIIVGGYNVYPREVEEVIYQHPAIVEVAVIGIPDKDYGQIVKAFVVSEEESITMDDILHFCKDKLAKYKLPKQIEFMNKLPKNSTGKIVKRALNVEQMEV